MASRKKAGTPSARPARGRAARVRSMGSTRRSAPWFSRVSAPRPPNARGRGRWPRLSPKLVRGARRLDRRAGPGIAGVRGHVAVAFRESTLVALHAERAGPSASNARPHDARANRVGLAAPASTRPRATVLPRARATSAARGAVVRKPRRSRVRTPRADVRVRQGTAADREPPRREEHPRVHAHRSVTTRAVLSKSPDPTMLPGWSPGGARHDGTSRKTIAIALVRARARAAGGTAG